MSVLDTPRSLRQHFVALFVLLAAGPAFPQSPPVEMRYKFHAGDRLVYREVFEREGKSQEVNFRTRAVFSNQLVVLDEAAGASLVGVQRNRQSAELLEYREHGKDKLAEQAPQFQQRLEKRTPRFADTNLFSAVGQPQMPVQVVREATSKLLYGISEIMPLPVTPAQLGMEWNQGALGLRMTLVRFEPVGSESCAVFSGANSRNDVQLQYTFCSQSGQLAKLTFEGEYRELEAVIHEKATLELESVHHQESPLSWLADQQTQLAALSAYLVSSGSRPDLSSLEKVLSSGTPDAQALALAVAYAKKLTLPQPLLAVLRQSKDAEVRRIAGRFEQPAPKPVPQPCELPEVRHTREKPGTTLRGMNASDFAGTPYMIHVPLDYTGAQPFPLIIYLSGGGGLAFDGAQTAEEVVGHAGYLVVYPHAGGAMWWESHPAQMVKALLLEILRSYNVDTNRVYLAGFSNGGTGALEYATLWPDRLAAVASLMGAGTSTPSSEKPQLRNLQDLPILFLHGDSDPLIPSSASVNTYDELRGLHLRVPPELHILKGRGHDITWSSDDGYTLPFFERFTREPFPAGVTAKLSSMEFPRYYWLEIVEKEGGAAEVEARISPDNRIDIRTKNIRKLRLLLRPELFHGPDPVQVRLNGKDQPAVKLKRDCQLFRRSEETYADPFLAYTDEAVLDVPK